MKHCALDQLQVAEPTFMQHHVTYSLAIKTKNPWINRIQMSKFSHHTGQKTSVFESINEM